MQVYLEGCTQNNCVGDNANSTNWVTGKHESCSMYIFENKNAFIISIVLWPCSLSVTELCVDSWLGQILSGVRSTISTYDCLLFSLKRCKFTLHIVRDMKNIVLESITHRLVRYNGNMIFPGDFIINCTRPLHVKFDIQMITPKKFVFITLSMFTPSFFISRSSVDIFLFLW